ncbi:MAG: hypothetical protein L6R35_006122 [Caloplaca aegaea]|nr:MAG: hypothetical protein L6R35_006122 [Caloplaca aegaea]
MSILEKNDAYSTPSSDNLPRMHGEEFPYQMIRSSMGIVFSNFERGLPVPNPVVMTLLQQAGAKLELQLALNPSLETEPMREQAIYVEEDNHQLMLAIEPRIPRMTYGDQYALIAVLASWVMQYESVECRMVVWRTSAMHVTRTTNSASPDPESPKKRPVRIQSPPPPSTFLENPLGPRKAATMLRH